jgi:holliday junction DNA helicase RuvA
MFAKLTGLIDEVAEDHLVLDCGGVGYLVFASARSLDGLRAGDKLSLRIETMVGEDHIRLYGFRSAGEQRWFRLLQSVQGVGARVALAILSVLPPERLSLAISEQDKASLGQASGVGPKLAQRIVTELRDKAGAMPVTGSAVIEALPQGAAADAVSALVNLGFQPALAQRAVAKVRAAQGDDLPLGALVKAALREAANG